MNWTIFSIITACVVVYVLVIMAVVIHYKRHPVDPKDFEKGNTKLQKITFSYFKIMAYIMITVVAINAIAGIIIVIVLLVKNLVH
jgi:hypothetical protein